ncbi:MAG: N-acyl homoserine lactonase family protein [Candidatus Bipolaricaulia bacterium]
MLDQSFLTWNHGIGTAKRIPVFSVFIDHPEAKVLFDTGFDLEQTQKDLPFEEPLQTEEQTIAAQLDKIGVQSSDIDILVNSHLHFDHCGANKLFPDVENIINKWELREAFVPEPFERLGYNRIHFDFPDRNYRLIEGDYGVLPGIQLIFTPGHTVGHYSLLVELDSGPLLYVSDAAWGPENLEHNHPMGLHHDPLAMLKSFQRLRQIIATRKPIVLYPHDFEQYETYKKTPDFYE